jgi:hypothetical protein
MNARAAACQWIAAREFAVVFMKASGVIFRNLFLSAERQPFAFLWRWTRQRDLTHTALAIAQHVPAQRLGRAARRVQRCRRDAHAVSHKLQSLPGANPPGYSKYNTSSSPKNKLATDA